MEHQEIIAAQSITTYSNVKCLALQLPKFIESKNDVKIVYYYLNKFFNCSFEYGNFGTFIFNPELIQLLFGNAKQLYIYKCFLSSTEHNIENLLQFTSNYLACQTLRIYFLLKKDIMEEYKNILFKILTKGDNFEEIQLDLRHSYGPDLANSPFKNITLLYQNIVEYIATSRDCSKMVPVIILRYYRPTNLQLNERAEKVEIEQRTYTKYTKYQITNIYNPKVRFSFTVSEMEKDLWTCIDIRKV
ncbi:unnamed protein product [Meloidogyne enterolobii]|uniref:Uncharacterized protein n=1 Tax=Meloidogyne enterolobii TaxID=390850 RepID=A0ACB0ZBC9_MELEN